MNEDRVQRRLTTILAADVAGYSRLMGQDEEGTLAALKAHRREMIDPKITEHRGRVVKTTGDGLLVEFPSVVDAVRCAVEMQRGMALRNESVPEDRRLAFRVGVNVGDVIIDEDGDIFGDGVNVAARLEGLAEPGGIVVSRSVRDYVRDKLSFDFEDMGERQVKNIARPVEVHRIRYAGNAALSLVAEDLRPLVPPPLPRPPARTWPMWLGVGVVLAAVAGGAGYQFLATRPLPAAPSAVAAAPSVAEPAPAVVPSAPPPKDVAESPPAAAPEPPPPAPVTAPVPPRESVLPPVPPALAEAPPAAPMAPLPPLPAPVAVPAAVVAAPPPVPSASAPLSLLPPPAVSPPAAPPAAAAPPAVPSPGGKSSVFGAAAALVRDVATAEKEDDEAEPEDVETAEDEPATAAGRSAAVDGVIRWAARSADSRSADTKPAETAPAAGTGLCAPGQRVEVQWQKDWWPATVRAAADSDGRCPVRYDGYGREYDESVPLQRLRGR